MTIDPVRAILLSLQVGLWSTLLGLPVAILCGWLLARDRLPGRSLIGLLLLAPLVLPPVVTGFLLLKLLGRQGLLGGALNLLGVQVPFSLLGAVVAAFVVGLPLFVLAARSAFEVVDPRLEEVSQTLGVPPAATFRRVTLPLAFPGLAAGALLVFARALGEFGATAILAGNIEGRTRTISLAIYTLLDIPGGGDAIGLLVGASLALSFGALIGYELLLRRQKRRLEIHRG